ncbi:MAG: hypothetical protein Q9168_000182 [Polycauliona sp. 1 TL-2023]
MSVPQPFTIENAGTSAELIKIGSPLGGLQDIKTIARRLFAGPPTSAAFYQPWPPLPAVAGPMTEVDLLEKQWATTVDRILRWRSRVVVDTNNSTSKPLFIYVVNPPQEQQMSTDLEDAD